MEDSIKAKIVIEILGTPKEHVEKTMNLIIEKLKKEKDVKLLKETTYKAEKVKELWSTFSDLEIEVKDMQKLIGVCFDYMPSSVEIMDPLKMSLETKYIEEMFNDLLAKLHKVDMVLKNALAENKFLKEQKLKK